MDLDPIFQHFFLHRLDPFKLVSFSDKRWALGGKALDILYFPLHSPGLRFYSGICWQTHQKIIMPTVSLFSSASSLPLQFVLLCSFLFPAFHLWNREKAGEDMAQTVNWPLRKHRNSQPRGESQAWKWGPEGMCPGEKKGPRGASQKNLRCYIWKAKEAGQRYQLFCKGLQNAQWLSGKRIHLQCRKPGFSPWVKIIPWRRK